jgi:phosphomannomutase
MCRHKIELKDRGQVDKILPRILARYAEEKIDALDGVKILRDRSWVQVRASNTEPIMRIMAEAPTAGAAEKLCKELATFIFS